MELYFLRHGEAEPTPMADSDADRALTQRGRHDVTAAAQLAKRTRICPAAIYTSPLLRARQTGEILADVFGVAATAARQLASGPSLGDLQDLVSDSGCHRILFVGHEPYLSAIVQTLTGGRVKMRTANLAHVHADLLEPGRGILMCLLPAGLTPGPAGSPSLTSPETN
ncbi:MAG: phosphohistidine phosphatase SixA [Armatimonadetes bacterium]|nr:phosphohistidine phosphatase SixA [Armatimonadota bacterium]